MAALALVATALALPAGAVASSHFAVDVAPFAGPIIPLSRPGATEVHVMLKCGPDFVPPSPMGTFTIELSIDGADPAWALAIAPSSIEVEPISCAQSGFSGAAQLTAGVTQDAAAFASFPFTLVATAEAGPATKPEAAVATAAGTMVAGFHSLYSVSMDQEIFKLAHGETGTSHVAIQNLGNGPTRFAFTVEGDPPPFDVTLPPPLTLPGRLDGTGPNTATVEIRFKAPRGADATGTISPVGVSISSSYASDETLRGATTELAYLVQVKAGAGAGGTGTAAPPPVLLLVVIALVAVALRRR